MRGFKSLRAHTIAQPMSRLGDFFCGPATGRPGACSSGSPGRLASRTAVASWAIGQAGGGGNRNYGVSAWHQERRFSMDLGKRLRELRERRGFSIYEVERRARLHFSTISKYERNERQPSIDVLQELADVYGVPLASIFAEHADLREYLSDEEIQWLSWLRGDRRLVELLEAARGLSDQRLDALLIVLSPDGPSGRDTGYTGRTPPRRGRRPSQPDSGA